MKKILATLMVVPLFLAAAGAGFAALLDKAQNLEGVIARIEGNMVTISQKATEAGAQGANQVQVRITPETNFAQGQSLAALKQGDAIKVQFKEETNGDKVALQIAMASEQGMKDQASPSAGTPSPAEQPRSAY